jgi:glycosyltransferase involved in cell wall biosynthesis
MIRALREAGNAVTVLCLTEGEYWQSRIKSLGVTVVHVGRNRSRPVRLFKIVDAVRRLRPDVIQSSHFYTNFPAAVAGKILGIPAIGAVRTDGLKEVAEPGKIFGLLNLKTPGLIAGNSEAGLANARTLSVPERRLFFLPNVVDCEEFDVPERAARDSVCLLTAGRLVEQKRHDRFLRLLSRLRISVPCDIRGVIAGDGPKRDELRQQMVHLGLTDADVELCGVTRDMKSLYNRADVFVLTSDWEGTPNVVLEAMASGVPVVSTDVGDVRSLVEDGVSGFLVASNDEDGLTARVTSLVQDPALRRLLGQNARRRVEKKYSLANLTEYLESLYTRATGPLNPCISRARP